MADIKYYGNKSLKLNIASEATVPNNGGACFYQNVAMSKLEAGGTYTLSGYIRTSDVAKANTSTNAYGACMAVRITLEPMTIMQVIICMYIAVIIP